MAEERVAGGAVSRLIIRQVKMNDSAEFCCLAGNSYGRANTSIVLIVEVRTLLDCRTGPQSDGRLVINHQTITAILQTVSDITSSLLSSYNPLQVYVFIVHYKDTYVYLYLVIYFSFLCPLLDYFSKKEEKFSFSGFYTF